MRHLARLFAIALMLTSASAHAAPERDTFPTTAGELTITFLKHASLMLGVKETVIHLDPVAKMADYSTLPKADLILITHEHSDHFEPQTIQAISKPETKVILTETCAGQFPGGKVLNNGEETTIAGIDIQALPAYNLVHKRDNGELFHPKGRGNGYLLTIGGKRLLIGGDTENIPELKGLTNIDIAFLPMNLPYTMTPEMVADAALCFKPAILYPYHFGETKPSELVSLLKETPSIEVRVRDMP